jgi:tripartite-type tricarboxylate transporter receptor subunit TctC
LGKSVVIDNRPGAGGMIGAEQAAIAPNDGYNLFFTVKGVMAIVPHVYPSAKFKPLQDFKAVTEILQVPHIIVATNGAPFNDMNGLVEFAKKNPGKLNYASNGVGSIRMWGWRRSHDAWACSSRTCLTRACRLST